MGITKVLLDEAYANCIKTDAYKKIHEKYDWNRIAQQTKAIYDAVSNEYSKSAWT